MSLVHANLASIKLVLYSKQISINLVELFEAVMWGNGNEIES